MSVSVTRVGNRTVFGDKHVVIADLTFTSTYPNEGEPLSASALGFSQSVEFVLFDGAIIAADGETAIIPKYDYATSAVLCYESAATGLALLEKTASEAYPTNATVRVIAVGKGI